MSTSAQPTPCPVCGNAIPADSPVGWCPACLMDKLLGEDAQSDPSSTDTVVHQNTPSSSQVAAERKGDRIGRYKLLQEIGQGGFGTVWMAEQVESLNRRVAVKIIKLGMDTREVIARFEAERQALAMMDHPNIARVLDAGATELGRPFFVMELVKGIPITLFCDERRLGTRARLTLFADVCSAINHAHQKGIIHRDIKPSNVMVTLHGDKPVVKVIDFGIAKATQGKLTDKTLFTRFEQFIGTPVYMSPEQTSLSGLDIDTRSDIYSLGILLYELLTGNPPFDSKSLASAGYDEMRRIIREVEPPRPSARLSTAIGDERTTLARARQIEPEKLGRLVEPDLDWIVMKAIEKDRERRYETASALALDIQRFLQDEAVSASPPSVAYLLRKYARRNRTMLRVVATIALLLVMAAVVSISLAVRATRAEQLAVARLTALTAERDARENARRAAEEESARATKAESLANERSRQLAEEKARADEETGVAKAVSDFLQTDLLRQTDDGLQVERGFEADDHLTVRAAVERAADRIGSRFENQPLVEAAVRHAVGDAYLALGNIQDSTLQLDAAVKLFTTSRGEDHPSTLDARRSLADAHRAQGDLAEAEAELRNIIASQQRVSGPAHPDTLKSRLSLAATLEARGMHDEGEAERGAIIQVKRETLTDNHPETVLSRVGLAIALLARGKPAEAEKELRGILAIQVPRMGPFHPRTLESNHLLAHATLDQGRAAEAETLFRATLEARERTLGPAHPDTCTSRDSLAQALEAQGKAAQAEALHTKASAFAESPAPGAAIADNNTVRPPSAALVRGPVLCEEMRRAKIAGGRLHAWGTLGFSAKHVPIDVSSARSLSDFIAVNGGRTELIALRRDGSLWASTQGQPEIKDKGLGRADRLFRSYWWPAFAVGRNVFRGESSGRPFGTFADEPLVLAQCWNSADGIFAVLKSGAVEWTSRLSFPGAVKRAPAHITSGVIAAAGAGSHIVFLTASGTLRTWEAKSGTPGKDIPGFHSIVEIDGGDNFAIARRMDGQVLIWGGNDSLHPPPDLKPAVAVRAGSNVCAAQHPDGTWTAWGGTPMIADLVRLAGKAIDLDLDCGTEQSAGERGHFVIWISPVTAPASDTAAQPLVDWEREISRLEERSAALATKSAGRGGAGADATTLQLCLRELKSVEQRALQAREESIAIQAHLLARKLRDRAAP